MSDKIYTIKEPDGAVTHIDLLGVGMIHAQPMGEHDATQRVSIYLVGGVHWFHLEQDAAGNLIASWRAAKEGEG